MRKVGRYLWVSFFIVLFNAVSLGQKSVYTLKDCIDYASSKNIDIQKSYIAVQRAEVNSEQAKLNRLPSLEASASENVSWSKSLSEAGTYGTMDASDNTSVSVNSGVTLFNGLQLSNQIKLSQLNLLSSQYASQMIKESVEITILDAFLQVLFAQENVLNTQKQLEVTDNQLKLAEERLRLKVISNSDYLQVKSEMATEKYTFANAKSQLALKRIALMQLMELSVDTDFSIEAPELKELISFLEVPNVNEVYRVALDQKPQVKQAELSIHSASLSEKMAKAQRLPSLALNAGVGAGYRSSNTFGFSSQMSNSIAPSVGLSLSIPIFKKNQINTNVKLARLDLADAQLQETNVRNQLRKEVEQACLDVVLSQSEYQASQEKYQAVVESGNVADEKFKLGLINAVDLLYVKNNLINAESSLLQAKYQLIFNSKILDYYKGNSLSL